ncbi:MAG TPA: sugar kinase [Terriglobales bacterium]|nr:sugar kinase [Terriglobales bacterium]
MPRFDVAVAGELNLDLILYGLPEDLPRERELLADRMMLTLGSSSAIVAHNLAALGARVGFVSCIGDDPLGQIALERLAAGGVDVSEVRKRTGKQTGLTVLLQRDGWRNIITYAGTIFALTFDDLDFDYLTDSRHFHLSSYFLHRGLRDRIVELLGKMKAAGLTISLDTNDDPDDLWQGGLMEALRYVDVFLPNAREAKKIAGTEDAEAALASLAKRVPLVVMKIGAEGAVAQRGEERFSSPAVKVNTVDSVGAGDSFDAGFLWQYLCGADLSTCLTAGNLAGAFSTTRSGGTEAFRDREYREKFFAANTTDLKLR